MIRRSAKSAVQWLLFGPLFRIRPFDGWITHNILSSPKPREFQVNGDSITINCANSNILSFLNKWISSPHESEARKWLEEHLCDNDVFLNVGSHVGTFVIYANCIRDLRHTIAIEASSPNVGQLLANLQLNGLNNVSTVHCAAGERNDLAEFNFEDVEPGYYNGRLTDDHYAGKRNSSISEFVHVRTIDSVIDDLDYTPTIMLMDIDGHEVNALKGMRKALESDSLRALIVETNRHTYLEVNALLEKYDFQNECSCPDNPDAVSNRLFLRASGQ